MGSGNTMQQETAQKIKDFFDCLGLGRNRAVAGRGVGTIAESITSQKRILGLCDRFARISGEAFRHLFITHSDEDGKLLRLNDLWLFSESYAMLVEDFDNPDKPPGDLLRLFSTKNRITRLTVKSEYFELGDPDPELIDQSRLTLTCKISDDMSIRFTASGLLCLTLAKIIQSWVVPNLNK
jgi:hypothetical protein